MPSFNVMLLVMVSKKMSMDRSVSHITLEKLEERGKLRKIKETKKKLNEKSGKLRTQRLEVCFESS